MSKIHTVKLACLLCALSLVLQSSPLAQTNKPSARKVDEFPDIQASDLIARLDNLAIELQNNPGATGYIISYAGRTSRPGTADRMGERARGYLLNTRGISADRLVVINGGYRENNSYEIWLVPQGAAPPQATPTVQPGEVRPAPAVRRTRRR